MSLTKIIILFVGIIVVAMVFGKVKEASGNPFQVLEKSHSCNGIECIYKVEIKNNSLQKRRGVLGVETYSIIETDAGSSRKTMDFRSATSFHIGANETKAIYGELASNKNPSVWVFDAQTVSK